MAIQILENVSLKQYSTMHLGGTARYVCIVNNRQEVAEAVAWALERQLPPLVIGGGSNIVWRDEGFDGLLIVNNILGYEDFAEDATNHYVTVGAGEKWDDVVARSVSSGLSGIECLSLIPGSSGATPVQNVGAYGQEISQTLVSVEAFDLSTQTFSVIPASECNFAYRASRFNRADRGRFIITSLTVHLLRQNLQPPFYDSLHQYLESNGITDYTPAVIRNAVIDIRNQRLPNPAIVANNGSFFGNPIISAAELKLIRIDNPLIPNWPTGEYDQFKIPAAWLVEQAGFKNHHDPETGMATWPQQCLVLVNERAQSTADLLRYKQKIVDAVQAKFGITLVQEPELLP